jgi:secreted trypsin-like serine protease
MPSSHTFLFFSIILCLAIRCVADHNDEEALDDRIVGGEDAEAGEFPFFVQWRGCGASLIWEDVLLTAAHVRQAECFELLLT